MAEDNVYGLSPHDVIRLRTLMRAFESGTLFDRPRYRKQSLPWRYPHLIRARLTSTMNDDNPVATANIWLWDYEEEDWYETDDEVELHSFLRPDGEEIPERTRVFYAEIGGINEVIVANCSPDPEETPP